MGQISVAINIEAHFSAHTQGRTVTDHLAGHYPVREIAHDAV